MKHQDCTTCEVRGHCIFSGLEQCYLHEISDKKNINHYKKGSTIFHENNYPLGLFGIFSGKVKVYKTAETGKEHILALAKAGDVLGYRSLISGEKYEVSASAIDDCEICFVPKTLFIDVLKQSNNLTHTVMEMLTRDLKVAEEKIADLAQKSVKERVAETILMLKHFYGMESDEKTINVTISREDIANLVGTATETLIRSLSEFKKNKVIDLKGKKIAILNYKLLEKLANNVNY
ncbi:MAG: Crp/Fnr family transcriptional regulator [Microscillaceae bacterium]|nr:Crp/Fnr family transcriptional regulator [Microscillaceae bacterium]